ncbi:MAG: ATP-binding cassette domain-containing protein [Clostridia bacterium]|nr:ATP-binding cassette domain-containing protein [Clostridia bacterium]
MFLLEGIKYKGILDINKLTIPEKMVTCIIGESGSGKTTLLRLLNNLISSDEGEIFFKGTNIKEMSPMELRRRVVMLSQVPAIFGGTIKDNLLIGLRFSDKPQVSDDKLREILRLVHLDKDINEEAEKMSGGEKQRLALGRVILLQPEVFLLDEPSSALDENTERIVVERLVKYVKENEKTMVMVTHSREIASTYADNIIEISKNKSYR